MFGKYFKKNSTKFLAGSVITLLLALFLIGYPVSDLYNRNFLPQPEPVTELYFVSPNSLPHNVTSPVPAQFSFRVISHEASPTTYSYLVTISTPGLPDKVLTTGNFTILDSESNDIPVTFSVSKAGVRSLINVQLIGRSENIHFWVNS